MDRTPTRKEITHDRIVDAAARALRRDGYAGVTVADVMRDAGLTHGGFYAHFPSREALLAEAIQRAGRQSADVLRAKVRAPERPGHSRFRAFVETYLDDALLTELERGCPVAAVCSEMPRQSAEVREASSARVRRLIAALEDLLPEAVDRRQASVVAGALVGALQVARAVGSVDEGRVILAAARASLLSQYDA